MKIKPAMEATAVLQMARRGEITPTFLRTMQDTGVTVEGLSFTTWLGSQCLIKTTSSCLYQKNEDFVFLRNGEQITPSNPLMAIRSCYENRFDWHTLLLTQVRMDLPEIQELIRSGTSIECIRRKYPYAQVPSLDLLTLFDFLESHRGQ